MEQVALSAGRCGSEYVEYSTHKIHKKMLQGFDDILVLSHGKLVEHGSFEDLLCKKNYFYHLFMNQ